MDRSTVARFTSTAALVLALAGCSSAGTSPGPSGTLRVSPLPDPSGSPVASPDAGAVPQEILDLALADAAALTEIEPAQITVVRAERATWNDGARGCPELGVMYTQAIIDGYWVVLDADGTEVDYRFSDDGNLRRCDRSGPVGPG
jgi:hypothetical protein